MATLAKLDIILGINSAKLIRNLNRTRFRIRRVGRQLESFGRTLTTGITAPLTAVGVASTKMATDFESSMSKITGLVGVSRDQVGAWNSELLKLAPALGKSPKELAEGMFFVTSAGLKGAQALRVLTASAKASAAGLGSTATVADAVTSAMNAYGSGALDAGRATGILVAAVREGKASAESFAPVLGALLPVAADAGVGFDEVAASLAAMTRVGAPAAEAATALRAILTTIKKPSNDAVESLDNIGLSVQGLQSMLDEKGLLATLQHLNTAFEENGVAMTDVFGNVRALSGVLSLTGGEAEKTAGIFARLATTTEQDLNKAFSVVSGTAGFKFAQVLSSIKVSAIDLGNVLIPIVIPAAERLGAMIKTVTTAFQELSPTMKKAIVVAAGIAAAIGPIIVAAGAVALAIGSLGVTAVGWIAGIAVGLGVLAVGWDKVAAGAKAMWSAVQPQLSEFAAFAGAQFEKIRAWASSVWPDIQSIIEKTLNIVKALWAEYGEAIMVSARMVWESVKTTISVSLDVILGSVSAVIKVLNGDFSGAWKSIKTTIQIVADSMNRLMVTAIAGTIASFYLLEAEAGVALKSLMEKIRVLGEVYLALPFINPVGAAALKKGLGILDKGMVNVTANTSKAREAFELWTKRAKESMALPFEKTVTSIQSVNTEVASMPVVFDKTSKSIIQVFDDAGQKIQGSLSGGFGKAATSVKQQVTDLKNHLNANPLKVVLNVDSDAFRRSLAELGLQPDTAGVLP